MLLRIFRDNLNNCSLAILSSLITFWLAYHSHNHHRLHQDRCDWQFDKLHMADNNKLNRNLTLHPWPRPPWLEALRGLRQPALQRGHTNPPRPAGTAAPSLALKLARKQRAPRGRGHVGRRPPRRAKMAASTPVCCREPPRSNGGLGATFLPQSAAPYYCRTANAALGWRTFKRANFRKIWNSCNLHQFSLTKVDRPEKKRDYCQHRK